MNLVRSSANADSAQNFLVRYMVSLVGILILVFLQSTAIAQTCPASTGGVVSGSTGALGCTATSGTFSILSSGSIDKNLASSALTISNGGSITGIDNAGTIRNIGTNIDFSRAIYIPVAPGTVGILNNSGLITSSFANALINNGTITDLINSGAISSNGTSRNTIRNLGVITNFTNNETGTISGVANTATVINETSTSTIGTLTNAGLITASGSNAIRNNGTIDTFLNSGSVTQTAGPSSAFRNELNISSFTNTVSGIISSTGNTNAVTNNSVAATIGTFINQGQIRSEGTLPALNNSGTITNFTNTSTGVIRNIGTASGITNFLSTSTIQALKNAGTISGGTGGFGINNAGTISSLINTGTINGITNSRLITSLNNQQGASSSALAYSGTLPTNYNIVVRSVIDYGQLAVTSPSGETTFSIYSGGVSGVDASALSKGTYRSAITGISSANLTGATSGSYYGFNWSLNNSSGTAWDLVVTASTADTQQSLVNNASALQSTFSLQNSILANSFYYDCAVFDQNNVCISAGGRNTAVTAANGLNNTSGLLIAAYRPHANYRVGAYVDQNLSVNNASSAVNLGNNTPLIGLFGAWNERLDGAGAEIKISAAYGQKNTTVTRSIVGTSDPGTGSSQLNSQGAQVTAKYGFAITPTVILSPYTGIRYTQNNMGGYTEATSAIVTAPLTYSALNTNATTVLAGAGALYRFIPQAAVFASAGVETDTNTANGSYSASGISGLTPINFNANPVKTRATATLGAYYDVEKNQRLGIAGIYRQEPYQAVSTTTVMATYTVGL